MLARHDDAASHIGRQLRLAPSGFCGVDLAHIADAIGVGLGDHGGKAGQLLLGPGGHQPATLQQRQIEGAADGEIFGMARLDAGLLDAAGGCIEAGMKHGAVGFAGTGQDVGRTFQKHGLEPAESEAAEEGATDHAAADDGEVEGHEEEVPLARASEREREGAHRGSDGKGEGCPGSAARLTPHRGAREYLFRVRARLRSSPSGGRTSVG